MKRRVVVTGMGALTPVGNNITESWENILKGKSGVKEIDFFDVTQFTSKISGSVRNFDATQYIDHKEARKLDLFLQYGMAAGIVAFEDSKLEMTEELSARAGVLIGSGIGGMPMMQSTYDKVVKAGPRRISPFFIPATISNMISGNLSMKYGFRGANCSVVTACATATHNIGFSAKMIAYGDADIMLCGGAEMATCELGLGGFCAMRALSTRNDEPEKASRPWDKDRDGFVMGDGAGILMLEEFEHAKKRGAHIYAELVGIGMSADAFHITQPDPEGRGQKLSMQNALNDAGINPEDIDYINAHGTSTPVGDAGEVNSIKRTFGDHAYKLAVSSTKSMTGHLLGATGSVEAIFSILALRDQVAPPTINLDNPDEGCDLNFVPHQAQEMKMNYALSNSFGFGGTNTTVILKKFDG
jgi:3-oxoacyl-[acyl-carrier-protein] synthase II